MKISHVLTLILAAGTYLPFCCSTAAAQQAGGAQAVEEIVVRGTRGSLRQSLEQKRFADDIRDVLTTTDVGTFPDQNLAEAVQRLPGIAITRNQGEGRFVSIRGLPPELNRIAWNGITLPSSEDDRAVPLDMFSADLFGSIVVLKSLSADKDDGALGGSINLETPAPLQLPDNTLNVTAKGFYNSLSQDVGPAATALASKKFLDETIGLVAGLTYSNRLIRQDSVESGGWSPVSSFFPTGDPETDELLVWENGKPGLFEEDRERLSGLLGLEADFGEAGHYRFDAMFSRFDVDQSRYSFLHRFKNADSIENVVGDGDKVVSADFINTRIGLNQRTFLESTDTLLTSLRGDWQLSPGWSVDTQVGWFQVENTWPYSEKYKFRPNGFDIGYDVSDRFNPQFRYNNFSLENVLNSPELFSDFDEAVIEPRDAKDTSLRLEANTRYELETPVSGITALQTGIQYNRRDKERLQSKLKVGSAEPLSAFLGDSNGVGIPGNSEFLDGRYLYHGSLMAPFDNFQRIIGVDEISVPPNLLDSFDVEEDVMSAYLRADFEFERFSGNFGVRSVYTEFTSSGYESLNGTIQPVTFGESYVEHLPSAMIRYDATDNFTIRAGAGRAMIKPQFADLAPRRSIDEDNLTIDQGNPNLDPFMATQADLSFEYYFEEGEGLVAVTALYKDVETFIFDQATSEIVDDPERYGAVNTPPGELFEINQPRNASGGEIWGAEISWQQPFDFLPVDGFGIQANWTWLDSSANFTANLTGDEQSVEEGFDTSQSFGIPGISSNVVNSTMYYQRERLTARVSYNYREKFLISPAGTQGQPEYIDDFDQIDAYIGYDVTDEITLFAEAINLNDEPLRRYSQPGDKIELYSLNGFRMFVGMRAYF